MGTPGAATRRISKLAPVHGSLDGDVVASLVASVVDHVAELVVVFDPGGTILWANEGMRRILGLAPARYLGEHAAVLAHPDDVPLGLELLASAKATGAGVKEPVVYRLRHAQGHWVDVECIASVVALPEEQCALVVSGRPTAQARPATAIFDEASLRVSAMFDRALIGMAQVSLDGRVLRANDRFAALFGAASGGALVDGSLRDLLPAQLLGGERGLLDGEGGHHEQVRLRERAGHDGRAVWARLASVLVDDHRGRPLYYALQAVDVSDFVDARLQLEDLHDEVLRRSQHDDLTGLPNRARVAPWLPVSAERASVLYLDLDGFKEVNDMAGHAAGDAVLVAVADRLRSTVRRQDVPARLGGDEFVVLCPYTSVADATGLAHRLVTLLSAPIDHAGSTLEVGASIGVAAGRAGDDFAGLVDRADRALYQAKAGGKGRVHVA